eukprot:TRINITY_DN12289_c0_g1_i1.p1 TRINITY_DN12289_c0_g1~~TRINITY_DN12289_c0_g1_i1.p1  ORF type:complete len:330 (-),score=76.43 TRINITY_DN12289_c0_g1_i1:253-1242(-)
MKRPFIKREYTNIAKKLKKEQKIPDNVEEQILSQKPKTSNQSKYKNIQPNKPMKFNQYNRDIVGNILVNYEYNSLKEMRKIEEKMLECEDYERALKLQGRILRTIPDEDHKNKSEYLARCGISSLKLQEQSKAMRFFQDALELDNEHPLALSYLGFANFKKGKHEEGYEMVTKALSIREAPEIFMHNALVHVERKEIDIAISILEKCLHYYQIPDAYYLLGSIYLTKGYRNTEKAKKNLEECLHRDLDHNSAILAYCGVCKDPEMRIKLLEHASGFTDLRRPTQRLYGGELLLQGNFDESGKILFQDLIHSQGSVTSQLFEQIRDTHIP